MLHQINDTTYSVDGLGDVKSSVLIGGKTADKFIPNVNASFYDDEFFINLNRKGKPAVTGKSSLAEIGGDDKDIFHIDDRGRLKWDIEFGECPKFLTLSWEIKCSDGIEFYYQGLLTEDEVADGCIRADDIVGSYAVYCDKANNKYKTGKLCHIPRPFVIDASGSRAWCDMLIADGVLTITLSEKFMQSAKYPVRLDPTFGYTTAGASMSQIATTAAPRGSLYNPYSASSGDTITSFSVYARLDTSGTCSAQMAAYSLASSDLASRLGSATTVSISMSAAWYSSDAVSIAMSAGASYGVVIGAYGASLGPYIYYDSSSTGYGKRHNTAETLPATWATGSTDNRIYSLYATYTDGGSGGSGIFHFLRNSMGRGYM